MLSAAKQRIRCGKTSLPTNWLCISGMYIYIYIYLPEMTTEPVLDSCVLLSSARDPVAAGVQAGGGGLHYPIKKDPCNACRLSASTPLNTPQFTNVNVRNSPIRMLIVSAVFSICNAVH